MRPCPKLASLALLPFVVVALGVLALPEIPLVDMPNHLGRAFVIERLARDPVLAGYYEYHFVFTPYILGDLVLAALLKIFEPEAAARVWALTLFLTLPLSWVFYLRSRGSALRISEPAFLALLSFLSLNYFYLSGYNSFCLSVALSFFAMGFWERWCRKPGAARYAVFAVFAAATYLAHLAGFFLGGVFIGVLALRRLVSGSIRPGRFVASGLPFAAFVAWHLVSGSFAGGTSEEVVLRRFGEKLEGLGAATIRYDYFADSLLTLAFAAIAGFLILRARKDAETDERRELGLLLAVAFTLFAVLPYSIGSALQVDMRAVLYAVVFALSLGFAGNERPVPRAVTLAALVLAFTNVAFIGVVWFRSAGALGDVRSAAAAIPPGKKVMTVYTRPRIGRMDIGLHQGELYTVLRGGFSPDVFNNNSSPRQFPYFSYRSETYTPGPFWYVRNRDEDVHWELIAKTYDYLLVMKPYDSGRIKLQGLQAVYENDSVVVLRPQTP